MKVREKRFTYSDLIHFYTHEIKSVLTLRVENVKVFFLDLRSFHHSTTGKYLTIMNFRKSVGQKVTWSILQNFKYQKCDC